jgi:hypothetical protein
LYLYCRITGTSVWDMLYVSRSSLGAFKTTVQEGMTKMWEEMRRQKEEVLRMVTSLGRKQDELKDSQEQLMAKQDQMDERLRRVSTTLAVLALQLCQQFASHPAVQCNAVGWQSAMVHGVSMQPLPGLFLHLPSYWNSVRLPGS